LLYYNDSINSTT